jgi:molybdopterin/thiamine biosynthesis adenylyltransferase
MKNSSRQSFLGPDAQKIFAECRVAIVGLGGGGSHIVQQLAHVGFLNFVLFDPDTIEEHNLNRLIGGTLADARKMEPTPKVEIAARMIRGLQPEASIELHQQRWQEAPAALQACDLVFGCLDGIRERNELQVCVRRFLIPWIDVGLDVHTVAPEPPQMAGQVVLTTPDGPCLRCLGVITEQNLADEATDYGQAGIRPQVVWANGVLASAAVGLAVELLTNWTKTPRPLVWLSYEGNHGTLGPHRLLPYVDLSRACPHFSQAELGSNAFRKL